MPTTTKRSAPAPETAEIYVASTSGIRKVKGHVYRYARGRTTVRANHPLRLAIPDAFKPLELSYETGPAPLAVKS